MEAKDSVIPFQERLKPDRMLREVADILREDERSGIKGGVTP